ncbi:MAG: helix-turn-helix domain-containing protein [Deltaproteobacteria bacterium]|nr:helix-turn-helix domain-containing protein [Deltaproteobacteria bacterium]
MKDDLFAELLESVRQGGAILRGHTRPSRVFRFEDPDVRAVREGYGLSQSKFAALMGISAATLRNWEQGRRKPEGSARVLLQVVARNPKAVLDVVSAAPNKRMQPPRSGARASSARRRARG